jgi:hypothetical protein
MPISVAFVETAHFSFHGLGDTPQQAIDAVMGAWAHHVRLTGAHPDHVTRGDVAVITGEPGTAFRDHSPFPASTPPRADRQPPIRRHPNRPNPQE